MDEPPEVDALYQEALAAGVTPTSSMQQAGLSHVRRHIWHACTLSANEAQASYQVIIGAGHLRAGCQCPALYLPGLRPYRIVVPPMSSQDLDPHPLRALWLLQAACSCCA